MLRPYPLVDIVLAAAKLDCLGSVIGAEEDDFSSVGLHTDVIEKTLQRNARPARIRRESLHRVSAVAGAFESRNQLGLAQCFDVVERQFRGTVHEAGDLEAKAGAVDLWMAMMLRCEELIGRSIRTIDLSDVVEA